MYSIYVHDQFLDETCRKFKCQVSIKIQNYCAVCFFRTADIIKIFLIVFVLGLYPIIMVVHIILLFMKLKRNRCMYVCFIEMAKFFSRILLSNSI